MATDTDRMADEWDSALDKADDQMEMYDQETAPGRRTLAAQLFIEAHTESFGDVQVARLIPTTNDAGDVFHYVNIRADVPEGVVPRVVTKAALLSGMHLRVADTGGDDDDDDTVIELR